MLRTSQISSPPREGGWPSPIPASTRVTLASVWPLVITTPASVSTRPRPPHHCHPRSPPVSVCITRSQSPLRPPRGCVCPRPPPASTTQCPITPPPRPRPRPPRPPVLMEATEATITRERGRGNQEVLTSTTCSNTIITNIRAIKRSTVSLTQQVGFSCYENTDCIFNWPAAPYVLRANQFANLENNLFDREVHWQ